MAIPIPKPRRFKENCSSPSSRFSGNGSRSWTERTKRGDKNRNTKNEQKNPGKTETSKRRKNQGVRNREKHRETEEENKEERERQTLQRGRDRHGDEKKDEAEESVRFDQQPHVFIAIVLIRLRTRACQEEATAKETKKESREQEKNENQRKNIGEDG
ncbi:hypothetical protein NC652_005718 [Populus alba x Populus x berolinensis]|nr:hypothetical protein NC652_005718 [Populus alba x Populus x berolinensis]